jgi:hypothetical protein
MKKFLAVFMCVLVMLSFATTAVYAKTEVAVQASSSPVLQDDLDEGAVKVVELFKYIFSLVDWSSFIGILISTISTILAMFGGGAKTTA